MPLWQIYHPPNTFQNAESKQLFAEDITKMYTSLGLPAFYVVTQFHELKDDNAYVGGKPASNKPFIRVVITHIAVRIPDADKAYLRTTSRIDKIMKPHVLDKGYDFEYHVDETERRLWKINSLIPPPFQSAEEQFWVQKNAALPYEGAYPPVDEEV
jgi:phenylpyruvate tautomerase PptA (4-oxalocrotonate tautomerase family)